MAQAQQSSQTRNLRVEQSSKRIALVIGNDAYQNVTKLQKAGNDAAAMAQELRAAGFQVLEHRNLSYRGMVRAVEALANKITGGDQVVVFFSGHGVQLKTGNYLLPTDIESGSESEIEKMSYGLDDLTEKLKGTKPSFTLVMVDACRDNPFRAKGTKNIGGTRGLSPVEPPKGQMVVFSASKGQQALDRMSDNDKNPNGVFTREFIARMRRPGVLIEDLVREVQEAVEELASTISHEQRPAIYNEAKGKFYFFEPTTIRVAQGTISADPEGEAWKVAVEVNTAEAYKSYLTAYPSGRYVVAANIKLNALEKRYIPPPASTLDDSEDAETKIKTAKKAKKSKLVSSQTSATGLEMGSLKLIYKADFSVLCPATTKLITTVRVGGNRVRELELNLLNEEIKNGIIGEFEFGVAKGVQELNIDSQIDPNTWGGTMWGPELKRQITIADQTVKVVTFQGTFTCAFPSISLR